ncbi:translocation protein TolB [Marinibacterium anthonyi]|nr:translocation protein TolB [Marinibacterium anthonyi]
MDVVTPVITNWTPGMEAWVEAVDVLTGEVEVLLRTNLPIQAPCWSPDGQFLIVNAAGRMYRIWLNDGRRRLEEVFVNRLHSTNNDHGMSPDGRRLAVTDMTEYGRSAIYVLRLDTLEPEMIVPETPSWFHGWAPDSRSIVYSCVREGLWTIARRDLGGMPEQIVIQAEPGSGHHYDAPEFSPDGQWIWFNSDRGQGMSLWRVRPDGRDAQRMTCSDGQDWFPHPSPDGRHVCYLTYPRRTRGHPFGREVELRVIPADGGAPRVMRCAFGGQGSLNAPCWAPDGRRFVYARYCGAGGADDGPKLRHETRRLPLPRLRMPTRLSVIGR